MDEAEHADRIAIIDYGKIVALGTPEALKGMVGSDVITVTTSDNGAAAPEIAERFNVEVRVGANGESLSFMDVLMKINPVTYAVDPLRQVVLEAQGLPKAILALLPLFGLGVSVFNHAMTLRDDVLVISLFGTVMITVAVWLFSLQD